MNTCPASRLKKKNARPTFPLRPELLPSRALLKPQPASRPQPCARADPHGSAASAEHLQTPCPGWDHAAGKERSFLLDSNGRKHAARAFKAFIRGEEKQCTFWFALLLPDERPGSAPSPAPRGHEQAARSTRSRLLGGYVVELTAPQVPVSTGCTAGVNTVLPGPPPRSRRKASGQQPPPRHNEGALGVLLGSIRLRLSWRIPSCGLKA